MTDFELTTLLRRELDEMDFCDKFKELWRNDFSRDELIVLYKRGIEFCIEHDWPKCSFIKDNFSRDTLREGRVFVDDDFGSITGENGVYVINGVSSGTINFDGFFTATIYIRHASDITIKAKSLSRVFIEVYDNASVVVKQEGNSSVYVYNKSDKSSIKCDGNIKTRN